MIKLLLKAISRAVIDAPELLDVNTIAAINAHANLAGVQDTHRYRLNALHHHDDIVHFHK